MCLVVFWYTRYPPYILAWLSGLRLQIFSYDRGCELCQRANTQKSLELGSIPQASYRQYGEVIN